MRTKKENTTYMKKYRLEHPEFNSKVTKKWREKNPEYAKSYYEDNREKLLIKKRNYDLSHKEEASIKNKKHNSLIKEKIFDHYGRICKCCGETEPEFLSIDHIDGGGRKHRKKIGSGNFYRWIVKNNFPEDFQTLCFNCNCSKGFFGKCPHEKQDYLDRIGW